MFNSLKMYILLLWLLSFSIAPAADLNFENANWSVFTNREWITALVLSVEGNTLWIATDGGLEKLDIPTGNRRIFTKEDGLPESSIETLVDDTHGGLWIGTPGSGLAYLSASEQWTVFNTENSALLSDFIETLLNDGQGGLWVGTMKGLAHRDNSGKWTTVFQPGDFKLPDTWVESLLADQQGGLWVGTHGGYLFYRDANNQWSVFSSENSPLPLNGGIQALLDDGYGGLWIGAATIQQDNQFVGGGLVHRHANGEWTIFNSDNSELPDNYWVSTLLSDGHGGLWMGTLGSGLAHLSANGEWTISNNPNLPSKGVTGLASDKKGGLWVGSFWGVSYFNAKQEWVTFETKEISIPGNQISALVNDAQGNLWLGTLNDGLAYRTVDKQWVVFNTINSELPSNGILSLATDGHDGIWIGTTGGLIHRHADEKSTIFNTENSPLPYNSVFALLDDGKNGVWVGTVEDLSVEKLIGGGLTHLNDNGQWTIFNTENSQLPDNVVSSLIHDGNNGLWIGTMGRISVEERSGGGLAHLSADQQWTIFNIANSSLPSNNIETLLLDNQDGLWIGTFWWDLEHQGGLAHFSADHQWTIFNTSNSPLPMNWVTTLSNDGQGGLWIATPGGLLHLSIENQWTFFDETNSGLNDKFISTLLLDQQSGLWIGTLGDGLTYLTFGQKTALCTQQAVDDATCQALQANQRAAIIIAGGGAQSENTLWDTTEFISSNFYNVLNKRGFDNDEIYYLTPKGWSDFNGDGFDDHIVDAPKPERPITIEDVKAALDWAKARGKLDLPLYLFFIDHGSTDKLQLSKIDKITAPEFKMLLDDYQTATGNDLLLLIDACYSGTFSQQLLDERFRRAIISSTNDTVAYFDRADKQGFSRSFAKSLDKGMTFKEAFDYANKEQQKLVGDLSKLTTASTDDKSQNIEQIPQFYDGTHGELGKHYLNNLSKITGDDTFAIESAISSSRLQVGQEVMLTAKTSGQVKRAWAVIRPPKMNLVLDTNGTPILAYPRVSLGQTPNYQETWQTTWNDAIYNGDYSITFYAEDENRNVASSDIPVTLTMTGGIDPPTQAQVQIYLDKTRYQRGELFKATLTEDLGWGYDLYAAVVLPDGNFFTLNQATNDLRTVNEAKPWYGQRKPHSSLTLFDLTLSTSLPTGQYCLYGILSPEQNEVFETKDKGLWVMGQQCFEVF
ncbi:two-component system sensor histidine kinase/response regulator [Thioploca ingrica]|uniref:Two-component system sensor histidine kinase/response regulator n=1 Tax=Thioploca ingrica TaxID=40754 RepID=A0A090BU66_9GAMM|nr:two-component system sensor histidine kinase/response regulator [Thioploca ingrica]